MSCYRFLLARQNIGDQTACSWRAHAFVCLHAPINPPTRTERGAIASAPLQQSLNLSSACALPDKTQSTFRRAIRILSP